MRCCSWPQRSAAFDGDVGPSRFVVDPARRWRPRRPAPRRPLRSPPSTTTTSTSTPPSTTSSSARSRCIETDDGGRGHRQHDHPGPAHGHHPRLPARPRRRYPIRYGHDRRLFTPAQAEALRARFRRCCHPFGCDRTGGRLQSNHTARMATRRSDRHRPSADPQLRPPQPLVHQPPSGQPPDGPSSTTTNEEPSPDTGALITQPTGPTATPGPTRATATAPRVP